MVTKEQLKDKPKGNVLRLRVDDETVEKLAQLVEKTGRTKSSLIREGIDKVYDELK
ncbi:TPA: ribbon-helix-helix protein, CopG family [Streptococcus suis]|nr:ribbon-helix-helix protein, CopG family [Streptococcus suis]HEM5052837.1 ribbon-helix-helix protein, CopG family [Streptococcus suis]HEM5085758.1 ribbon-helix-helix protein, CopG family [Streptococcus suis]HEM5276931.1 ribbon-helix-helix protein, CopG family [Streptococcus suis]HEM5303804.1 ribbon-helix-helix protein, CopG family [Streptococcus suis]